MTLTAPTSAQNATDRLVVVTSDSHVGPLLKEQLRDYCPRKYLERFDEFVEWNTSQAPIKNAGPDPSEDPRKSHLRNALTTGGWDAHQRIRDMDRDGVAGEIVFHGLNTGRQDLIPFNGPFGAFGMKGYDDELVALGRRIYNRWLADFCSVEPERHAGLAQIPVWDPAACVREVEWAAEAGLRGINFPRPQATNPSYSDPAWDDFWAACAANDMPLTTHAQGPGTPPTRKPLPGDWECYLLEIMGEAGRAAIPRMIFGGVFERHPNLKLVFVEVVDTWWTATLGRLDDFFTYYRQVTLDLPPSLRVTTGPVAELSKLPSEYCREQVFIGWTTLAPFEAEDAVQNDYVSQVLWGSDYPHPEGSWQYPRTDDEIPMTHLHLRDSFARVEAADAAAMVGGNAMRIYGLDPEKLQKTANRINSLSFDELATPYDEEPEDVTTRSARFCFRRHGPFG